MAHSDMTTENVSSTVTQPADELLEKWCSENNLDLQFKFSDQEDRCELVIPGYNYAGVGNSKNKNTARKKAASDFLLFLKSQNIIPAISKKTEENKEDHEIGQLTNGKIEENTEIYEIGQLTNGLKRLHVNPIIHGNWTLNSAKKMLKQFKKSNKENGVNTTCKLTKKGYSIEMSVFVDKLNIFITCCETETIKGLARKKCTLSLVSQLCSYGQIENRLGVQKEKEKEKVKLSHQVCHLVSVNEKLMNDVYSILDDLDIIPTTDNYTSIVQESDTLLLHQVPKPSSQFSSARVISWCPPKFNWNPWLGIQIQHPKSLMQLSNSMKRRILTKTEHSIEFQDRMKDRSKLPIFEKKNAIFDIINNNSVVIVQGGTGCGKTTQVCQFILDEHIHTNKGANCNIICTQPRKVSTISVAKRIAFERAENIGESIGYTVRFDSINPRPFGAILFCTVEILIRKLRKGLIGISHIIVDEIHERRADSEFLLIILKEMLQKYPDLRVILMSANANLKTFSEYFNNCPIIGVLGNCCPIKEYFLEDIVVLLENKQILEEKKNQKKKINKEQVNCNLLVSENYPSHIRNTVAMIDEDSHHLKIIESLLSCIENDLKIGGAILIFLPGWAWITELNDYLLQTEIAKQYSILRLHSTLSHAEQHKVFLPAPHGKRKVILSTNIAETSITIDDVVFVIDYGKVKLVEFHNNISKFNTVWASKVNVEQRKGRAGRVQPGICFNLYTKARFNLLNDNVTPELTYCPLSKIGLAIKLLHLGDIYTFLMKAINPPPAEAVNNVINLLIEMKCIEAYTSDLTPLGNILAQLPLDPKVGRMMILGNILMLGESLSIIAAGSSNNYDLFLDNYAKLNFSGSHCSDQLTFLNAFMQCDLSNEYCYNLDDTHFMKENDLSTSALKATHNIKNQILKMFIKLGFPKCCFKTQNFDFGKNGTDGELQFDIIPALLTMAFYPNIYCYTGNRKVNLKSKEFAIVGKSSVNSRRTGLTASPFFVFEEQVNSVCVHSTMVSPIHLLLFGARKVEYIRNAVVLDDWIFLEMDRKFAAAIVALRPAIEDLIIRTTKNPKLLLTLNGVDTKLINVVRDLCNFNTEKNHLSPIILDNRKEE